MFVAVNVDRVVEQRLAADHPLRRIRQFANTILASMSDDFDRAYSDRGRMSVPPECMLKALLWQALYTVRSERQLEEVLRFDLRARWFVGLGRDPAWASIDRVSGIDAGRERLRLRGGLGRATAVG